MASWFHMKKSLVWCTEANQIHDIVFHLGFYTQQVLLSVLLGVIVINNYLRVYLDVWTGVLEMPLFTPFHGHLFGSSSQPVVCMVWIYLTSTLLVSWFFLISNKQKIVCRYVHKRFTTRKTIGAWIRRTTQQLYKCGYFTKYY